METLPALDVPLRRTTSSASIGIVDCISVPADESCAVTTITGLVEGEEDGTDVRLDSLKDSIRVLPLYIAG